MSQSHLPVVFSGAQPTGQLTLGNYLGALRQWIALQADHDCIFCVVDLHALTVRQDPEELADSIYSLAALYLACGIDPSQSTIFVQSHVPAHSELAWLLNTYTQMGELERMTQFKDKSQRHKNNINAGLFTYPVLMAADILLYGTQRVPVGEDQKQHLELSRDIAMRFNGLYGDVLVVPEPMIPRGGARVKDLQEPTKKMSKSAESDLAKVMMLDDSARIVKKFKKAVTDNEATIRFDEVNQPGVANLLNIYTALTGMSMEAALAHFDHHMYGKLKVETAEAVVAVLEPIRTRYAEIRGDRAYLQEVLAQGAEKARARAEGVMRKVQQAIGLPLDTHRFR
ncbi:tryptophanyl-tRNA synthetase [Magnetococcus marinus MC-1]|uniref:Tryptophan--tRNA ligase n=1 Tax=Magnetococcus marinus (strain ATCC BAA-1437 / JCM 17883 / MC-1) TaxID=156889 RepID=A0L6G2_MAGMM|nr:tryptophan--tRNA ligase [Magnetococcus marinus]ABK43555.1 tryptophanyl-tRNA synthetase [Magnetococcus marinus MC-1]